MHDFVLDDVYDVWFTSFWQTLPGYGILSILGISVLLLGYVLMRALKIYRTGTTKDQALRYLCSLTEKVQKGQIAVKQVYQETTDIIKSYAQWRYALPRGVTDYELIAWLENVGCSEEQRTNIEGIIVGAQAVKFGRDVVLKKQILKDLATVTSFIEVAGDRKE